MSMPHVCNYGQPLADNSGGCSYYCIHNYLYIFTQCIILEYSGKFAKELWFLFCKFAFAKYSPKFMSIN
jgi:hypothetical protein